MDLADVVVEGVYGAWVGEGEFAVFLGVEVGEVGWGVVGHWWVWFCWFAEFVEACVGCEILSGMFGVFDDVGISVESEFVLGTAYFLCSRF